MQAKADGIQGNFSGDLLQSGGMLIVAKGTDLPEMNMSIIFPYNYFVFLCYSDR